MATKKEKIEEALELEWLKFFYDNARLDGNGNQRWELKLLFQKVTKKELPKGYEL